jgi:hypothetical protein
MLLTSEREALSIEVVSDHGVSRKFSWEVGVRICSR